MSHRTSILIEDRLFNHWDSVRINLPIDSMSTAVFSAPFDYKQSSFREAFRPLSYKSVNVLINDTPLFSGTMLDPSTSSSEVKSSVSVSCYSLPGVLNDCPPPPSAFPIEFNNMNLKGIADSVCSHFGLQTEFQGDLGAKFSRVSLEPSKKSLAFLSELAKKRNFIISSNSTGKLLFWRSTAPGNPVAMLRQGESPVLRVTPNIKPQGYYSDLTGLAPVKIGERGGKHTEANPHLDKIIRPTSFNVQDSDGSNLNSLVKTKTGRMIARSISYDLFLSTWSDPIGNLWQPNTTLKLIAPKDMIYKSYEFLIKSVELVKVKNRETAKLTLVLPGVFSGEIPRRLPWDE